MPMLQWGITGVGSALIRIRMDLKYLSYWNFALNYHPLLGPDILVMANFMNFSLLL